MINCISHSIEETGGVPGSLKLGNRTPIFKKTKTKQKNLDKSNYRPVSILPLLLKVYEQIVYNEQTVYNKLLQHPEHLFKLNAMWLSQRSHYLAWTF